MPDVRKANKKVITAPEAKKVEVKEDVKKANKYPFSDAKTTVIVNGEPLKKVIKMEDPLLSPPANPFSYASSQPYESYKLSGKVTRVDKLPTIIKKIDEKKSFFQILKSWIWG